MLLALSGNLQQSSAAAAVPQENHHINSNSIHNNNNIMMSNSGGSSGGRKRFRTKFSQSQKEKMFEFAERVGWKMQKRDDDLIHEFCNEVGVDRTVLKVWMHNNKNTFGKRDLNGAGGSGSGTGSVGGGIGRINLDDDNTGNNNNNSSSKSGDGDDHDEEDGINNNNGVRNLNHQFEGTAHVANANGGSSSSS